MNVGLHVNIFMVNVVFGFGSTKTKQTNKINGKLRNITLVLLGSVIT